MSTLNYKDDMRAERVWYARAKFGQEEIDAVVKTLNEFQLSPGKYTTQFEKEVAKLFGKDHGVMVNSGSSALLLAAELLNIQLGDEIITGASGFPTTINPFLQKGAKVVLVDVHPETLSPKLDQIEAAINSKTKAIVVAHIWGALNDMPALRLIADKNKVALVEDSCDSIGQTIDDKPSGYWSDISVTSFFPSHVITACGGGGMICVKTEEEEKRLRVFRDWGRTGTDSEALEDRFGVDLQGIPYDAKFFYGELGYNLKATEVQAAFGLEQLKKLKLWNEVRANNYEWFTNLVNGLGFESVQPAATNCDPSWLAFPFYSNERRGLATFLENNNIQTRPILAGNFLRHPVYVDRNVEAFGNLEGADYVTRNGIGIGLHQDIGIRERHLIENALEEFVGLSNNSRPSAD